jgi:DNA glycosylase AlkZ-like
MDLRAVWFQRQGLPRRLAPDAGEVLRATGWVHTGGGQLAYLALHARSGIDRAAVDAAVERGDVHEIPAVRGCTMLVPAEDVALALHVARAQHDKGELAVARKHFAVTDKELDKLCRAVLAAVGKQPLEPKELHAALGPKLVRSLGEAGKKRGMSTTLPLALGLLNMRGQVRRISTTGRLDNQRFRYARWGIKLRAVGNAPAELARRFFRWAGPATLQEFAWWAGLGVKAAREAVAGLTVSDGRLDLFELAGADDAPGKGIALVPFRDNYTGVRRDLSPLYDPALARRKILDWDKGTVALGDAESLHQPAILDGGELIGLWDYDDRDRSIVWRTFARPGRARRKALEAEVDRLLPFIRDQLGNARYYSLDNDKQRWRRLDRLKAMV